ncbi:MAG: aminomethyl-transferring glycine dehydrogenase subunit GcvPA [SAR324 cluster bacterium]|nr:aminomethyl-transferring glycine dehydrogenase subunit GcvPA [SAR324 cluster bacterium]
MRFIPNNGPVVREMLDEMGLPSLEALFDSIPPEARLGRPLDIPPGLSEEAQLRLFEALAGRNEGQAYSAFLGAGSYSHYIPLTIDSIIQRGEFLTAYTPYQPEISQGTLQAIFEFQTFITILTGMEVANASMYDGASATAEAVLMAGRLAPGRCRVLLSAALHPHYRRVVDTHTRYLELETGTVPMDEKSGRMDGAALQAMLDDGVCCVVVQQPNAHGVIEDMAAIAELARAAGALLVVSVTEALSLALLEAPGRLGADIVVGEAQSFGTALQYGGPYLGFMATREAHRRQLPGRIAGATLDADGRRGFVLTLATREQHIRRENATSNICTNENLVMLSALVYLTLMGREGLRAVARRNLSQLRYFLDRLAGLPGYAPAYSAPGFNEVTVRCPRPAAEIVARCAKRRIVPGLDLSRWDASQGGLLLVAVTETSTKAEIDALIEALGEAGEAGQ